MGSLRSGPSRQSPGGPILRSVRLLVAVATVVSLAAVSALPGSAQSGGSYTYSEGGLEWSVSYDDSVWTEGSSDLADLALQSDNEQFVQFLTLPDNDEGAAGCLAAMIELFEGLGEIPDAETYETEDGEPAIGETDTTAWEIRTITLDGQSGQAIHVCWTIDDGAALWAIGLVPESSGDLAPVYTLFDAVSIAGEPVPIGLPLGDTSGAGDAEATPDSNTSSDGGDEEATPGADNGAGGGDGAGDGSGNGAGDGSGDGGGDGEGNGPGDGSGDGDGEGNGAGDGSGNGAEGAGADEEGGTYSAPTFGYSLAFDPAYWSVFDERVADEDDEPRDYVVLDSQDNTSRVYVEGSDSAWNDTDECVDVLLAETLIDLDQAELLDGPDGEPYQISEEDRSAVAYLSPVEGQSTIGQTTGDAERYVLVDCRADAASGVIVGFTNFSISEDPYFEGNYAEVEAVIDSLVFRDGPGGEESTPVAGASSGGG